MQTAVEWLINELTKNGHNFKLYKKEIEQAKKMEEKQNSFKWMAFDFNKIETRPIEYGKYLVCRKDGKIHWETWNNSGWAYNGNVITHWAIIKPPF